MDDDAGDPDAYDEETGTGDEGETPQSSENPSSENAPSSGATGSTSDGARPPPADGSPSSAATPSPADLTEPANSAWDVMLGKFAHLFLRYRMWNIKWKRDSNQISFFRQCVRLRTPLYIYMIIYRCIFMKGYKHRNE